MPTKTHTPPLKRLEMALSARYGWKPSSSLRDELVAAVATKATKLALDHTAYCEMALSSPGEIEALAELAANGETRFFREPYQFEALRSKVIPQLLRIRNKERRLDAWSTACSTGEEAYSLAIVLKEELPDGEGWKANLIATDFRGCAIMTASGGRYAYSTVRPLEKRIRDSYFARSTGDGRLPPYDVSPPVRRMITFRRANVCESKFWKNFDHEFDLVVCNYLLLYLSPVATEQIVERMSQALRRGGCLMVMKNEAGYVKHKRLKRDASLPGAFFTKV